ncbi:AAA family ATPase [Pseudonocardia petroleophila]|uniref:ATP-binding protein n=1 Tax=Pseudonocardia petroleophila TaxID=37331 RepID=A0A7G7MKL8_9PSEU|nr:AAA family ATPase [Pseudonocardia petroleophila]QNG53329.1 ATP-binding protein [Pseudonocardia petroleophila]
MYLHRIQVSSVRGFSGKRTVDIQLRRSGRNRDIIRSYAGWNVIAGRNGSGKTTLLRAIALALAGPEIATTLTEGESDWVTAGKATGFVVAEFHRDGREQNLGSGRPATNFAARLRWNAQDGPRPRPQAEWPKGGVGGRMAERSIWSPKPTGWFSAGYGPFRRLAGSSAEVARLMAGDYAMSRFVTLFREEASLAETVQWLQQVNYRVTSGRSGYASLEANVLQILNDGLFPDGHKIERVDPDGLWIGREGQPPIRVEEMSDGYRTVSALVIDIIRQIYQCFDEKIEWDNGELGPRVLTSGIVLIDEVDVHLHVSWQKKIGPWLVEHFPGIQFIVTTHSPYVCQTADEGGLIRLAGPNEKFAPHIVDEDLHRRVTMGSGDDAVMTELFGLDSPYSLDAERARRELSSLEAKMIRGEASEDDRIRLSNLVEEIEPSPLSRVQDISERSRG